VVQWLDLLESLHLMLFYFQGSYRLISHRILGLNYVRAITLCALLSSGRPLFDFHGVDRGVVSNRQPRFQSIAERFLRFTGIIARRSTSSSIVSNASCPKHVLINL
jgi:hypothetical protein